MNYKEELILTEITKLEKVTKDERFTSVKKTLIELFDEYKEEIEKVEESAKKNQDKHESYGMMRIGKVRGGKKPLFGSEIKHDEFIEITICHAVKERRYHSTSYFADTLPIVKCQLSKLQFSELITSMNIGDGLPVTLTNIGGVYLKPYEIEETEPNRVEDEFNQSINNLLSKINNDLFEIDDILNKKGNILKKEREDIKSRLGSTYIEIKHNLPFIKECFKENMEKIVLESKANIVQYVTRIGEQMKKEEQISSIKNDDNNVM